MRLGSSLWQAAVCGEILKERREKVLDEEMRKVIFQTLRGYRYGTLSAAWNRDHANYGEIRKALNFLRGDLADICSLSPPGTVRL